MTNLWELPLIMNEASQQKYSCYMAHEKQKSWLGSKGKAKLKRDGRNPFGCLSRTPQPTSSFSFGNLKSYHVSQTRLDNSPSLDLTHSLMPTLPPLTSVTAPPGSALKAYEEVHGYAR